MAEKGLLSMPPGKGGAPASSKGVQRARQGGGRFPFVISLPHCSGRIPQKIRSALALTDEAIALSIDIGTSEIFGAFPAKAILRASWSRLVVDLNRSCHDRRPKGVIATTDYDGRPVYRSGMEPDEEEREKRLRMYYLPYHRQIKDVLVDPGIRVFFDCHSLFGVGPREAPDAGAERKDIILGNNGDGEGRPSAALGDTTCPPEILNLMREAFQRRAFSVTMNSPYSGGFITTHYGKKFGSQGAYFVQIEVNQNLYAEPGSARLKENELRDVRGRVFQALKEIGEIL